MRDKHNYIVLHDGSVYMVMERMGKDVPFSAYNPSRQLGIGESCEEAIRNSIIPSYQIEDVAYEVVFNE